MTSPHIIRPTPPISANELIIGDVILRDDRPSTVVRIDQPEEYVMVLTFDDGFVARTHPHTMWAFPADDFPTPTLTDAEYFAPGVWVRSKLHGDTLGQVVRIEIERDGSTDVLVSSTHGLLWAGADTLAIIG